MPAATLFDAPDAIERPLFTGRDLMSLLFKHQLTILLCFVTVAALVAAGLWALPATYLSEAKLLVKTEQQGTPSFLSGIAAYRETRDADPPNRKMETEMEILGTRALAEEVVKELGLTYRDVYHAPYVYLMDPIADLAERWLYDWFGVAKDPDRYGFRDTVDEFRKSYTVQPLKSKSAETNSNLIRVTLRAVNPAVADKALNLLLQKYVRYSASLDRNAGRQAYEIVERNVREAAVLVAKTQEKLNRIMAVKGMSVRPASPLVEAAAKAARGARRTPVAYDEAPREPEDRMALAASRLVVPTEPEVKGALGDENAIAMMKAKLASVELELSQAKLVYTDNTERVRLLEASAKDLRDKIRRESARSANDETQLIAVQRDMRIAEDIYLDLQRKARQIALYLALSPTQLDNRVVVESALPPDGSEWKKSVVVGIVGALAGLLLGLALAGMREYMDHRLQAPLEAERHLGMPVLGVVPQLSGAQRRRTLDPAAVGRI